MEQGSTRVLIFETRAGTGVPLSSVKKIADWKLSKISLSVGGALDVVILIAVVPPYIFPASNSESGRLAISVESRHASDGA